ncbi:MAG TPA: DUF1993 domain-containing protein [Telmatospirillum sp.]|nr:DUF1993 domain-containing protein [Telmatospirillum sp.]
MSLSMYQASIPVFQRSLGSLSALLDKAVAFADAKKIDPSVLLNARLAPDMFPLVRQVQLVCDFAKGPAARLAGVDVPSVPDVETTFPELQARITKTQDYLNSIHSVEVDGSEERSITLKLPSGEMTFSGQSYLLSFALPNFFFHLTAAYAILRHNGVDVGKRDYLGSL